MIGCYRVDGRAGGLGGAGSLPVVVSGRVYCWAVLIALLSY